MTTSESRPAVLVVDDDAANRNAIAQWIEEQGYAAHTARFGLEAINVLARLPDVGLVILDPDMTVSTGLTSLVSARSRSGRKPFILLATWLSAGSERIQALGPAIDGYMQKPLATRALQTAVARALSPAAVSHAG